MPARDAFDPELFLPYLLNQAAEGASLSFQRVYTDRYGMLRNEWRVMFHLGAYGPMTARAICDRAHMHKTKISRAVAALERRRFLRRVPQATDRRSAMLHLTGAGRAAYDDLAAVARDHDARLTRGMSDSELALLRRVLIRLARSG